jgi:hypothetical protein
MSVDREVMWRGVIVWEDPDGWRFDRKGAPRLSKAAANGDVTRARRYPGRNTFVSCRVERSPLTWSTVEVDGQAV